MHERYSCITRNKVLLSDATGAGTVSPVDDARAALQQNPLGASRLLALFFVPSVVGARVNRRTEDACQRLYNLIRFLYRF